MIILAGPIFVVAGLLKLGFITAFLSRRVMAGFVFGLAIFVTVSQLPKLFGLKKGPGDTVRQFGYLVAHLGQASLTTFAVGAVALILLFALERYLPRLPGGLIVLGADPDATGVFADLRRHRGIVPVPGVLVVRPDAPLFYANAELVRDAIEQAAVSPAEPVRAVVLVLDGNDEIDITTAEQLGKLADGLRARNVPRPGPRARPGPGDGRTVRAARHRRRRSRLPGHGRRRGLGPVRSRCADSRAGSGAGPSGRAGLDVSLFSQVPGLLRLGSQPDALLAVEQPVQAGREHAPDQGRHDEQPHLAEGRAADDEGRAEAAGRVHRGAGDRDADQVNHGQRQPDGDGCGGRVGGRRRHPQDDEDEQRRQDDLEEKRSAQADVNERLLAPAVGAQAGGSPVVERRGAERAPQDQRADDPAGELGDPVARPPRPAGCGR
jgi:Sulfate permease family/STAS domain